MRGIEAACDADGQPEAGLRRLWDWFSPMVPYDVRWSLTPTVPRWWQWRMNNVPGWVARHLATKAK